MTKPERIAKGMYWDRAWSLVEGCSYISEGCANCWSAAQAHMRANQKNEKIRARYAGLTTPEGKWNGQIRLLEQNLDLPLRVKKPTVWAVWNDLFHEAVPDEFIDRAFAVMALRPDHTFMVLTKRAKRMAKYWPGLSWRRLAKSALDMGHEYLLGNYNVKDALQACEQVFQLPLPNVMLGVTAENQQAADERIPILLQIPAAVRFVSVEPMLGPVDLTDIHYDNLTVIDALNGLHGFPRPHALGPKLDLVISGGENGPNARPMHPDWVRGLRDQCQAAEVSFFFKQWGEWIPTPYIDSSQKASPIVCIRPDGSLGDHYRDAVRMIRVGKKAAGRLLDGRTWDEIPEVANP